MIAARPKVFQFEPGVPGSRARAEGLAEEFRADSVRDLRVPKALKGMSRDRLYEGIRDGSLTVAGGMVIPSAKGGSPDVYGAFPNSSNALAVVAATTSIKTVLQVATPSTTEIIVIGYSVSFDASAAGKPLTVELVEVDVAATVTSLTPGKYSQPGGAASLCVGGTSATGYNASAEGTIGASRFADGQLVPPTSGILGQWPLGREFRVAVSKFLRIRVTGSSGVTPNAAPSIMWME